MNAMPNTTDIQQAIDFERRASEQDAERGAILERHANMLDRAAIDGALDGIDPLTRRGFIHAGEVIPWLSVTGFLNDVPKALHGALMRGAITRLSL